MTKLKVGEIQSGYVQYHQTLVSVISQALGGGSSSTETAPVAKTTVAPKNATELMSSFNSVFGNG